MQTSLHADYEQLQFMPHNELMLHKAEQPLHRRIRQCNSDITDNITTIIREFLAENSETVENIIDFDTDKKMEKIVANNKHYVGTVRRVIF